MGDAVCGPSNPLQSFQKLTQVDRTLQQDRLTGPRQSPAQGFRSVDPRAAGLDAEFATFENAAPSLFPFEQQGLHSPFQAQQPPAISNWAAEFQQLHISNQPIPSQHFRHEAPLVRTTGGGWHEEFMRQRQAGSVSVSHGKESVRHHENNFATVQGPQLNTASYLRQGTWMPPLPYANSMPSAIGLQSESVPQLQVSEAQFEQAFAEAFQHAQQMESSHDPISAHHQDTILHEDGTYTNERSFETEAKNDNRPSGAIRIGSDAIPYIEQQDRSAAQDARDADELARTAGQLLDSVQHDTSSKFQESQFLSLMRKIRDREVEVQNEDFQQTDRTSSDQHNAVADRGISAIPDNSVNSISKDESDAFSFPDMNQVYNPTHIDSTVDDYAFDWDQYPRQPSSQIQALHPGGQRYPVESPPPLSAQPAMMSGARIVAEDFDRLDESAELASRYFRPTVEEESSA